MLNVKKTYLFENDKPFFWLGDTAWLLTEKLKMDDTEIYFKNRQKLGFNVIQVVLFYTMPNKTKIESGMSVCEKNTFNKLYLNYVNDVISLAQKYHLYIALLPCWGSFFKENIVNEKNSEYFAEALTNYFSHHNNLIWVLGGDVKGDINLTGFNKLGLEIKKRDSKHLITFHPFGRTLSARWFNDSSWLDFNMFQSGHRRYDQMQLKRWDDAIENFYGEDSWKYVDENFSYEIKKPCLDAEPSYEGVVQGLHDVSQPYWEAKDVRRYAYWSVFQGACGFTYGNNSIIQFHNPQKEKGSYGVRESWQDGLHSEGGAELQYLKKLMESVDYTKGRYNEAILLTPQKERYYRVSVFAGDSFIFAYTYMGNEFELDLSTYKNIILDAYWMNPQNGSMSYFKTITNMDSYIFKPTKRHEDSNDWVLVLYKKND